MAITYNLEDHKVTFHWDKNTDTWSAKSNDIKNLNLEAKSFAAVLKMLKFKHPEFANSIHIFFPSIIKS